MRSPRKNKSQQNFGPRILQGKHPKEEEIIKAATVNSTDSSDIFASPVSALCQQVHHDHPRFHDICHNILHEPPRYHRKLWEFVYIIAMLEHHNMLSPNKTGIGFGCGTERLTPGLISAGANLVISDLDFSEAKDKGWLHGEQHSSSVESFSRHFPEVCTKQEFQAKCQFRVIDMNHIPADTHGKYDFTWSSCSLEHLGSLEHGLQFILESMKCLKSGGVAVHTTEYNVSSNDATLNEPSCCYYRRRDIEDLIIRLTAAGCKVYPVDYSEGALINDKLIDIPPYKNLPHLKLQAQGYTCTSIGLCIVKE
jgi:hypothetical protein